MYIQLYHVYVWFLHLECFLSYAAHVETENGTALRSLAWKPVLFMEMGITPPLMANALILKETVNMFWSR